MFAPIPTTTGMQHRWSPDQLRDERSWCYQASAQLIGELSILERSHHARVDRIDPQSIQPPNFPALFKFAGKLKEQLGSQGLGVAKLSGLLPRASHIGTASIAFASAMGTLLEPNGQSHPIEDRRAWGRTRTILASQACKSIGFQTDSTVLDVVPDIISLSYIRNAVGGNIRLVSMAPVYETLMQQPHAMIDRLHRSFVRTIVTPSTRQDQQRLLGNRFPIFSTDPQTQKLTFRYMRPSIEQGQQLSAQPIDPWTYQALEWLDGVLSDPEFFYEHRLMPGEILWVDNRDIAHAHTSYRDNPNRQRLLLRTWISR